MKTIGEKPFAKDADGRLLSRIGTVFLRTPGLVTARAAHALQRIMWIDCLNEERAAAGLPPMSEEEENAEIENSVDLIFTDSLVLIRPDPDRMDLAVRADEELQKTVSKRCIRYLNTSSAKVRAALCARGENWRMARHPISQEDVSALIAASKTSLDGLSVYYYNRNTGTRFLTAKGCEELSKLDDTAFRRQVEEVVVGMNKRNRLGNPEIDVFPVFAPIEVKKALKGLAVSDLSDMELRYAVGKIDRDWRMAIPPSLRDESVDNFEWRNAMCSVITRQPNETDADEQELVSGIAAEFYRQIEWLPGACICGGEVVFDGIYAASKDDPSLCDLCDPRVKALILNLTRLFGSLEFINVGRIVRSLARRPVEGSRRGSVYIVQYKDVGASEPSVVMIRFQKWGVAERLDEGKDLLQAMVESDEYSDYILDRRLMCRQLGMNLPRRIGHGHFTEVYRGSNRYNGTPVRTAYFARPYISGTATDKIAPSKFHNPAYALRFAALLGTAAAVDMAVGRRSSVTGELLFDQNYEVVREDGEGLPQSIVVTDHAGSFVNYETPMESYAAEYAQAVRRRREFVGDYGAFADAYAEAVSAKIAALKEAYSARREAFDGLFRDRPFDKNGSGAYRWSRALARLASADPCRIGAAVREAAQC